MKFSLSAPDLRNFKARITEHLIRHYLEKRVKPKYLEAGYYLLYFQNPFFSFLEGGEAFYALHFKDKNYDWEEGFTQGRSVSYGDKSIIENGKWMIKSKKEKNKWINQWKLETEEKYQKSKMDFARQFLEEGFYPDSNLLDKSITLGSMLGVWTDGIIYKLHHTGKFVSKNKAMKEVGSSYLFENLLNKIPLVDGEIEIVEVKSDTGFISGNQLENYKFLIENGFFLHYFHVFVNSIIKNDFEIEEQIIKSVQKLKNTISYFLKISRSKKKKTIRKSIQTK